MKDKLKLEGSLLPQKTLDALRSLSKVPAHMKKDAHPENWLIDGHSNIYMIDFESSTLLPQIFEVVQLIDDYPLLPANSDGWASRIHLCRSYLDSASSLSGSPAYPKHDELELLYALYCILICAAGLQRAGRKSANVTSSSALRAVRERAVHYRDLLSWITVSWANTPLGEFADNIGRNVCSQA